MWCVDTDVKSTVSSTQMVCGSQNPDSYTGCKKDVHIIVKKVIKSNEYLI